MSIAKRHLSRLVVYLLAVLPVALLIVRIEWPSGRWALWGLGMLLLVLARLREPGYRGLSTMLLLLLWGLGMYANLWLRPANLISDGVQWLLFCLVILVAIWDYWRL